MHFLIAVSTSPTSLFLPVNLYNPCLPAQLSILAPWWTRWKNSCQVFCQVAFHPSRFLISFTILPHELSCQQDRGWHRWRNKLQVEEEIVGCIVCYKQHLAQNLIWHYWITVNTWLYFGTSCNFSVSPVHLSFKHSKTCNDVFAQFQKWLVTP